MSDVAITVYKLARSRQYAHLSSTSLLFNENKAPKNSFPGGFISIRMLGILYSPLCKTGPASRTQNL